MTEHPTEGMKTLRKMTLDELKRIQGGNHVDFPEKPWEGREKVLKAWGNLPWNKDYMLLDIARGIFPPGEAYRGRG